MSFVSCYTKPLAEPSQTANLFKDTDYEKYAPLARQELNAWLNQLKRTFPFSKFEIQEISSKAHSWWEVVIPYDENDPGEADRAFNVVDELPYNWDYKAQEELGKEYFQQFKN